MDLSNPIFIATLFSVAVGLLLYYIFVPRNESIVSNSDSNKIQSFILNDIFQSLPKGVGRVSRKRDRLDYLIEQSGNPWNITKQEFFILQIMYGLGGLVIGGLFTYIMPVLVPQIPALAWIIVIPIFAFFIPTLSYKSTSNQRNEDYIKDLPEALDLLIVSLSSGASFSAAVKECTPYMRDGVIKDEFQNLRISLETGKTLDESLNDFGKYAPNDGIKTFVKSLQEANRLNVPIVETLKSRSDASREEFFAWLRKKAATLETKMRLTLLLTMLVALIILLVAPSAVQFATNF